MTKAFNVEVILLLLLQYKPPLASCAITTADSKSNNSIVLIRIEYIDIAETIE